MNTTVLQMSQPKAWIWMLMPFILGLLLSGVNLAALIHPTVIAFAGYFTLPANLVWRGAAHIQLQRHQTEHNARALWRLKWQMLAITAPFLLLLVYLDLAAILVFVVFILASVFAPRYPVLRLLVYLLPAIFGFFLMGGDLKSLT